MQMVEMYFIVMGIILSFGIIVSPINIDPRLFVLRNAIFVDPCWIYSWNVSKK